MKFKKKNCKNGKQKYFKLFNETRITKHLIDISLGKNRKLYFIILIIISQNINLYL